MKVGHLLGGEAPTRARQTQALTKLGKQLALIVSKVGAGRHESYPIQNFVVGIQVLTIDVLTAATVTLDNERWLH